MKNYLMQIQSIELLTDNGENNLPSPNAIIQINATARVVDVATNTLIAVVSNSLYLTASDQNNFLSSKVEKLVIDGLKAQCATAGFPFGNVDELMLFGVSLSR